MNGQDPSLNNQNNNVNGSGDSQTLGTVSPMQPVNPTSVGVPEQVGTQVPPVNSTPVEPGVSQVPPVNPMVNATQPSVGQADMANVANPLETQIPPQSVSETPGVQATEQPQVAPVAQPIPTTMPNISGVGLDPNPMGNVNSNGFVEPQKTENIGTVPPPKEEPKKKKKMNPVLFVILIIVLIVAVAYGVYYYLSISKKVTIKTKDLTIGIGEVLPESPDEYITVTGTNSANCKINKTTVNTNTVGEYEYTVTCGDVSGKGKIYIKDTTAPTVALKVVYAKVGDTLSVDDFIESCDDPSNCTYSFENESAVSNYLTSVGGPNKVKIKVSDNAGNETIVESDLYVVGYDIITYLECSSKSEDVADTSATLTITDELAIGNNGMVVYLGAGRRKYTYVFTDANQYKEAASAKSPSLTYDNHTGIASYDDKNKTIVISTNLAMDTLNSEAGGSFATDFSSVKSHYESTKGYTCQTKNP